MLDLKTLPKTSQSTLKYMRGFASDQRYPSTDPAYLSRNSARERTWRIRPS
jgi:hypothetical protein